jgi:hypothetical protein
VICRQLGQDHRKLILFIHSLGRSWDSTHLAQHSIGSDNLNFNLNLNLNLSSRNSNTDDIPMCSLSFCDCRLAGQHL